MESPSSKVQQPAPGFGVPRASGGHASCANPLPEPGFRLRSEAKFPWRPGLHPIPRAWAVPISRRVESGPLLRSCTRQKKGARSGRSCREFARGNNRPDVPGASGPYPSAVRDGLDEAQHVRRLEARAPSRIPGTTRRPSQGSPSVDSRWRHHPRVTNTRTRSPSRNLEPTPQQDALRNATNKDWSGRREWLDGFVLSGGFGRTDQSPAEENSRIQSAVDTGRAERSHDCRGREGAHQATTAVSSTGAQVLSRSCGAQQLPNSPRWLASRGLHCGATRRALDRRCSFTPRERYPVDRFRRPCWPGKCH